VDIVRQSDNSAGGDIVAGSKQVANTFNFNGGGASVDELSLLYTKLRETGAEDASGGSFCDELEHYLAARNGSDVRGLEEKLRDSARLDQLDTATELKEKATKAVMRYQSSRTAQRIYTIILTDLHTKFDLMVTPVIQEGAKRREVDMCIQQVLDTTKSMLGENALELTVRDLLALLYFLGGNCHIRWDKC
jgi:hypothetical protein